MYLTEYTLLLQYQAQLFNRVSEKKSLFFYKNINYITAIYGRKAEFFF